MALTAQTEMVRKTENSKTYKIVVFYFKSKDVLNMTATAKY